MAAYAYIWPFAAYLIGGIPTAYLIGKVFNIDVRVVGTRNVGTANTWREVGKMQGLIVLALDAGKGACVAVTAHLLDLPWWSVAASSAAAVIGHNFSPFLRFYGGKGVAVVLGASGVLFPVPALAVGVPVGLAALAVRRNVVLAFALGAVGAGIGIAAFGSSARDIALFAGLVALVTATAYARARREWHAAIHKRLNKAGWIVR